MNYTLNKKFTGTVLALFLVTLGIEFWIFHYWENIKATASYIFISPQIAKMDASLSLIASPGADLRIFKAYGIIKSAPGDTEPSVTVFVKFKGNLLDVKALGGKVGFVRGNIAIVEIPLHAVKQISQLPNVIFMEAPRREHLVR